MATCKDCLHYEACMDMLNVMGFVADGAGYLADKRCRIFEQKEQWIPVEEQLSEEHEDEWYGERFTVSDFVLVTVESDHCSIRIDRICEGQWEENKDCVTHWMPPPKPPRRVNEN